MSVSYRQILSWFAVFLSTAFACLWGFWGIIESFHEGWFHSSIWANLGMMFFHYLLLMFLFSLTALIAIRWPRIGGGVHFLAAIGVLWFFHGASSWVLLPFLTIPLIAMGIGYCFGPPRPVRRAIRIVILLPLATVLIFGIEPVIRISGRIDDGDRGMRHISANGVDLIWAPQGPGWPTNGVNWQEANRRCQYLSPDGTYLADTPQNIWRLPTVEELVRSMSRHGQNCDGKWDPDRRETSYRIMPDKESPLWDTRSQIIYWWTSTEIDERQAYIIVYDGKVWPRDKRISPGYLGFRAVKSK